MARAFRAGAGRTRGGAAVDEEPDFERHRCWSFWLDVMARGGAVPGTADLFTARCTLPEGTWPRQGQAAGGTADHRLRTCDVDLVSSFRPLLMVSWRRMLFACSLVNSEGWTIFVIAVHLGGRSTAAVGDHEGGSRARTTALAGFVRGKSRRIAVVV